MKRDKRRLAKAVESEMNSGPVQTVKARVKRVMHERLKESVPGGDVFGTSRHKQGRTLLNEIKAVLKTRIKIQREDGRIVSMERGRRVAEAFVEMAEEGSFAHAKEILDRQEGKVPQAVSNADGSPIKMYGPAMALDSDKSP